MNEPLEELYFNWLCDHVLRVGVSTPSLTYDKLFRLLHNTEYVWSVLGDDNRAGDGVELRAHFLLHHRVTSDKNWLNLGCSLFEMLIAFSGRAEFVTEMSAEQWFWHILTNLKLEQYNDSHFLSVSRVEDVLHRLIWRQYEYDGAGGMFPLREPAQDQRTVEIWYQFFAYLDEQDL